MSRSPKLEPPSKNSAIVSFCGNVRRSRSLSLRRQKLSRTSACTVRSSSSNATSFSTMPSQREQSPNSAKISCWHLAYSVSLEPRGQRMSNASRGMVSLGTQEGGMSGMSSCPPSSPSSPLTWLSACDSAVRGGVLLSAAPPMDCPRLEPCLASCAVLVMVDMGVLGIRLPVRDLPVALRRPPARDSRPRSSASSGLISLASL
mmetsp:Transcript_15409/g.38364  ORF Transcript_15409/g.38364 Transcript_15409/m.38364 type:complete len:203 (-) Transcript_15409:2019-2627(-)